MPFPTLPTSNVFGLGFSPMSCVSITVDHLGSIFDGTNLARSDAQTRQSDGPMAFGQVTTRALGSISWTGAIGDATCSGIGLGIVIGNGNTRVGSAAC